MKKIILSIVFLFAITFYSKAQDRIILITGDTLIGYVYGMGGHLYRVIKTDGKSVIIGDSLILNKEILKIQEEANIPLVQSPSVPKILTAGDYLFKASNYHFISLGMYLVSGICYGIYSVNAVKTPVNSTNVTFFYAGLGCAIAGFVYNEVAWVCIGKAGIKLNQSKVSLKIAPTHLGLSFKI